MRLRLLALLLCVAPAWAGAIDSQRLVRAARSPAGMPLILHNIGRGAQEEDSLFGCRISGHYRFAR